MKHNSPQLYSAECIKTNKQTKKVARWCLFRAAPKLKVSRSLLLPCSQQRKALVPHINQRQTNTVHLPTVPGQTAQLLFPFGNGLPMKAATTDIKDSYHSKYQSWVKVCPCSHCTAGEVIHCLPVILAYYFVDILTSSSVRYITCRSTIPKFNMQNQDPLECQNIKNNECVK